MNLASNRIQLAAVYCRDDLHKLKFGDYAKYLTSDEARGPHHVAAADVGERLHLADLYEHCFPRVPAHRDSAPQKLASTLDAARPPQ